MPSQNIPAKLIKGLVPAIDPKIAERPYVLSGKNFMVDLKGPYAAFSNRIPMYDFLSTPQNVATFRILADTFICTSGTILRYDTTAMRYYPVFTFNDDGTLWPWYMAEVSGKFYFCRKNVGLFMYDPTTYKWTSLLHYNAGTEVNDNGFVVAQPVSICASQGRLIVLGRDYVQWSALDDGTSLTPSLATGAGNQGLNLIGGKGYPLSVQEVVDGYIVYTQRGCFKGEISYGTQPFRHFPLDKNIIPINQFCVINNGDKTPTVLDRKGLFRTDGTRHQPFEPLFSEYLYKDVLTSTIINNSTLARLYYNIDFKWFIISLAEAENPAIYQRAFVYYEPRQEWGSFDQTHAGFGEISFVGGPLNGFNFGYFDQSGYFHNFINDVFSELAPNVSNYTFWQNPADMPPRQQDSVYLFSSYINVYDKNPNIFTGVSSTLYTQSFLDSTVNSVDFGAVKLNYDDINYTSNDMTQEDYLTNYAIDVTEDWLIIPDGTADTDWGAGDAFYRFGSSIDCSFGMSQLVLNKYLPSNNPLNSEINIGLFRIEDQQYPDELSVITNVHIGTDAIPGAPIIEDWNVLNATDDWKTTASNTSDEDYGYGYVQITSFNAAIIGTFDGARVFNQETLTLQTDSGEVQYYTCLNNGVYHTLQLTAYSVDQTFHLKSLEVSGFLSGRL